jgi:hypothetical protein
MTTHPGAAGAAPPQAPAEDPHRLLHSPAGAGPGANPGRPGNSLVKLAGLDGEPGQFDKRPTGPAAGTIWSGASCGRCRR